MNVIYPLAAQDRGEILEHLLSLSADDRRLRFGTPASDSEVAHYVEGIAFGRDAVFGARDEANALVGMTHVAQAGELAELGLSVAEGQRGRGLARAMFRRAALHARNRGIRELHVHCLAENGAILHLAREAGLRIVVDGREREAWLALASAMPPSIGGQLRAKPLALVDAALRTATHDTRARSNAADRALEYDPA